MEAPEFKLKSVFNGALDRPLGPARSSYLDEACAGDERLRCQVEALLTAHDQAGGFLKTVARPGQMFEGPPGPTTDQPVIEKPVTENISTKIGPYKLVQQLGEGGMGTVYLAEQTEPVKRRVALKLIKPGMDSAQVLRRFEAERQALALMDHSNIAKVLDAGTTAGGRPYFVMEMVKGVPITKYCDELRLSLGERLALFVPVCRAIQHAHQKGIIHRDIKPSNVMIAMQDGKAVPKVIDFGVAKALHQRLTDESLYTDIGQIVGTLEYMSPEQAELGPLDIDTRADVYALGVLLYELLTGTTPLDRKRIKQAAYTEMLRQIREVEPPKPSTRLSDSRETLASVAAMRQTEPARLTGELRGELDWIAMKCLEKDRTRRYESASGLARDIERYLLDETVEACPPSTRYRMGKFLRKHRTGVRTTAALVGLLLTGAAVSTWQAVRATTAETKSRENEVDAIANEKKALAAFAAEQQAKNKARQAIDLLVGAVTEAELLKDERFQPLRRKLLAGALKYYQEFIRDHGHDALARRDLAQALDQVGQISHESGSRDDARSAMARSLQLWQSLVGESPAVAEYQSGLARSHRNLGVLQRAMGERASALAGFGQAVEIDQALANDNPGVTKYQDALGWSYNNLGVSQSDAGDHPAALISFQRAIAIRHQLVEGNPTVAKYRGRLAESHVNLGNLQHAAGDQAAAMDSYEHVIAIQEKLVGENPSIAEYEADLAAAYDGLGHVSIALGEGDRAWEGYQRAFKIFDRLAHEHPTVSEYRRNLAGSFTNLGDMQSTRGEGAAAKDSYQEAVRILAKLVEEDSTAVEYRRLLGDASDRLGCQQYATNDRAAALASYGQAIEIQDKLVKENPTVTQYQSELAKSYDHLGSLHYTGGDGAAALEDYLLAHRLLEPLIDRNPGDRDLECRLGGLRCNLGNVERDRNTEKAMEWYGLAADILEGVLKYDPGNATARLYLQNTHKGWGVVLGKLDRHAEAARQWELALEHDDGHHVIPLRTMRAIALANAGDHDHAASAARELAAEAQVSGGTLYTLACILGLCSTAAADDADLAGRYAAEAVELLNRTRQAGFFADAANVARLSDNSNLESLREREDFHKLIEELKVGE